MRIRFFSIEAILVATALLESVGSVCAAELLMIEDPRCGPCLLFEREVGRIYEKTDEARRAPLRRLPFGAAPAAPYDFVAQAKTAPTFVLVESGRELGRFEGYSDEELFWMRLTVLLRELEAGGTTPPGEPRR